MRGLLRSGILLAVALGWGASAVSMRAQEPASSPGQARQRWFFDQRLYGLGFLPDDALAKAVAQRDGSALASKRILIRASSSTSRPSITEGQWISFGPEGINSALGELASGRINSLAIDPRNPATLYVAAAGGGVWKSVSRGTNWIPISDRLPSLASGAVAVDPFTGELWHGTGELNFCRDCYYGAGVYRSSDGGSNWTRVNPDNFLSSPTSLIAFDPQRPGTVFIGRSTALWKSSDGGVSWRVVLRGAVMDLAISPADSAIVYAAVGFFSGSAENGVYRSTDGGETWTRLGGGLPPQASMGRIALALAPSSPNVLYALIANASDQKLNGLFRSLDGGNAWSRMATLSEDVLTEAGAGQGAFNLCLAVDPENPAVVYAGGVTLWRSSDFGGSWENLTAAARLPEDPHEIIFEPGNPNTLYLIGDLGVWRSSDRGASFRSLNQSLAITQFQGVGLHPTNPNLAVGGTQDTGTLAYSGGSLWNQARPGDAGAAFYDAANPQVIYTVARRHDLRRSDDGGRTFRQISNGLDPADRIEFYPPFLQHPTQPGTLYLGTHRLWRSRDRGEHWEAISGDLTRGGRISALAISPVSPQTMYAGTSDGLVQVSTDGGASWFRFANPNFPDRYVTSIAADPRGPERMVVAVSGFGSGHVFRSADFGATWEDISRNLPDVPVNAVLLDALSPDTIYIGTDIGVFVMLPDGSWAPLQ
ncbi:MAG TPA: hypothetical protein VNN17_09660, partial [Terriglobia bacterium]|nr:hypothetical protein [Terriglobia bacterium]